MERWFQALSMTSCSRLSAVCALICLSAMTHAGNNVLGTQSASEVQKHIEKVSSCLPEIVVIKSEPHPCATLSQRMVQLHVPGVSIAVIHSGAIEWARGFGVKRLGGGPVKADTLFQAGSISKSLAAMAALHQVQEHRLILDADANSELSTWHIPVSPTANGRPVTLRELLGHTAGFTVIGFDGYAANEPVPTLLQVLDGLKPANSAPIRVENEPGTQWFYSGGGYVVVQQIQVDTAKQPYPKLLHDLVLAPIGMGHSTFQQPLPSTLEPESARPYQGDGRAVRGGAHTYPEMAAAGLWTTASDLALFIMEIQQSLRGRANHVLSPELTRQMLTPGMGRWGLGLEIGGSANDPYFEHEGANAGFKSLLVAYENHGDGAVVMTNAEGGSRLELEVLGSIASEYGWADFHPVIHNVVSVAPDVLRRYVGTYQFSPNWRMTIILNGAQLRAQSSAHTSMPIFPESQTRFFSKSTDARIEFVQDARGRVSYLILHLSGPQFTGIRR